MFARRFAAAAMPARLVLCAAVAFAPAAQAGAETAADCWKADEIAAARVGDLQSALMVLALKCQDTIPSTLAAYNRFMADRHDVVVRDRHLIQAHFVRRLGPDEGLKAATDYDTRLGNRTSSPVVNVGQCQKAGAYARIAATVGEDDLPVLAGMVGAPSALEECPVPVVAAAPAAMVIPVWGRPASSAVPVPVAGPAPAGGAVAVTPAVAVVAATAPVPAAVAGDTVKPAANADAVKALQAAVAALSQVAASLQPVAAAPAAKPADADDLD